MKKTIVALVAGVAIIIVVILGIAMTKPDTLRVERTTAIKASPETVFALINDFHKWNLWSPWEELDPAMERTYSGPAGGQGSVYAWSGNSDVGSGQMEIIESTHPSAIKIKLDFIEPFEGHNTTDVVLDRNGTTTSVTWAMYGPNEFLGKVMCVFVDMDQMIGKDFEKGLAQMKSVAEEQTKDIAVKRVFDAPPELVWRAWTDPAIVKKWWGPRGFTSPECRIDFREGGTFVFCMRAPKALGGNDLYTAGRYTKIVPMEHIEFTQGLSDKDGNPLDPTTIGMPADFPAEIPSSLGFREVDGKTELTAIEYGWTDGQMRDMSMAGLEECLDKLAETLK